MGKLFTIKEKLFIESHPELTAEQIGKKLGRDMLSIKNFRFRNKIKATPKVPKGGGWNKGISYNPGGRSIETRFKKGCKNQFDRKVGEVFMYKHHGKETLFIKTPESRDYPYARFVYEQLHGKLPKNIIVIFIDGNRLNCAPENLEAITRAEHMRRNQNRKKGAETLKKVWAVVKTFEDFGLTPPYKLRSKRKTA